MNNILIFLKQFSNLHYLYIHIRNRRMSDDYILQYINKIISKFPLLICIKLQLDKDFDTPINWNNEQNNRIKAHFIDLTFEGVLIHLWL